MRKMFVWLFLMAGLLSLQVNAQDASDEVTDDEMKRYARMEAKVAAFVQEKQSTLEEMIKNNEVLGGGARYNEIKAAWGKADKLESIQLKDDEKAAYEEIQSYIDSIGEEVKAYMVELIKDNDVLGAATYNKVKKALNADPSLKEKMNNMIEELKKESSGAL